MLDERNKYTSALAACYNDQINSPQTKEHLGKQINTKKINILLPSFLLFHSSPFFGVDYLDFLSFCSLVLPPCVFPASILLTLRVPLSLSLSLLLHFKRTNVSCSHCSTALVFCSQFSQEPGSSCCFKQPQSNPTQGTQKEGEKGLKN